MSDSKKSSRKFTERMASLHANLKITRYHMQTTWRPPTPSKVGAVVDEEAFAVFVLHAWTKTFAENAAVVAIYGMGDARFSLALTSTTVSWGSASSSVRRNLQKQGINHWRTNLRSYTGVMDFLQIRWS
jgi:hypothetical protein